MDDSSNATDRKVEAEAPRRKRRFKREDHHGIAGGIGMMREAPCSCGRIVLAVVDGLCGPCAVKAEYRRRSLEGKLTRADLSEKAYLKYKMQKAHLKYKARKRQATYLDVPRETIS